MTYDVEIRRLSAQFATDYPPPKYPEILHKEERPYTCLLIDTHEDYLICIPFRSHINHKNAYLFKNTTRSQHSRSGLDYSKLVLISETEYIDDISATVDQDEYAETMQNIQQIISDVCSYISAYVTHINGTKILHPKAFARDYQFSTLPYFHDLLGL